MDAASGHGAHRAAQVQEAPDGRARRDWRRGPGNLLFFFITLERRVEIQKSMSLEYAPSSEPFHKSAKQLFLVRETLPNGVQLSL